MALDPTSPPILAGLWLVSAAIVGLALTGWDKSRARRDADRIPEATLLLVALLGGSPGVAAGMAAFRHKTRKTRFKLAVAAIAAVQVAAALVVAGVVSCSAIGLGAVC